MAVIKNRISQSWLRDHFKYENGKLIRSKTWASAGHNRRLEEVGSLEPRGYLVTTIFGLSYKVHRLIWFYFNGTWPKIVDHINRNPLDNRIENLRAADHSTNAHNSKARKKKNAKSKFKGVYYQLDSKIKPWKAQIVIRRKRIYLGRFKTEKLAHAARLKAERIFL